MVAGGTFGGTGGGVGGVRHDGEMIINSVSRKSQLELD
jgi:hypothetical protein